jgi:ABC-2 type transport system permease protein
MARAIATGTDDTLALHAHISVETRPAHVAARQALLALLQRDLTVLRKNIVEFVTRTLVQPFLLVFVFLYVFPTIGQGVGSAPRVGESVTQAESVFATILVAGVVGIAVMFQGIQAVAMQMAQEFGYTREIEDRVQAPCPVWLVAVAKVISGAIQGVIAAAIVFPIAAVVHARGVHAHLSVHWAVLLTVLPLACLTFSSLGLFLGTTFEPRNLGLMFGFVVLPITFLGGTYYAWTALRPVHLGSFHWLQVLVLVNPLIYVTEGMRAALTNVNIFPNPHSAHMHLYVIYPALLGALSLFLYLGLRGFRRRVLA